MPKPTPRGKVLVATVTISKRELAALRAVARAATAFVEHDPESAMSDERDVEVHEALERTVTRLRKARALAKLESAK